MQIKSLLTTSFQRLCPRTTTKFVSHFPIFLNAKPSSVNVWANRFIISFKIQNSAEQWLGFNNTSVHPSFLLHITLRERKKTENSLLQQLTVRVKVKSKSFIVHTHSTYVLKPFSPQVKTAYLKIIIKKRLWLCKLNKHLKNTYIYIYILFGKMFCLKCL